MPLSNEKPKPEKPKVPRRPRLDALLRHIESGGYDNDIGEIKAAIDARNTARKDAVMAMVREVFGQNAQITNAVEKQATTGHMVSVTPVMTARRSRPGTVAVTNEAPEADKGEGQTGVITREELEAAEQAALARERELEAEMGETATSDEEEGSISNSPIIGAVER